MPLTLDLRTFPFRSHRTIREVEETLALVNRWRRADPPISDADRARLNHLLALARANNPPPSEGVA